jgi:aspartyl-tRNA synthetase
MTDPTKSPISPEAAFSLATPYRDVTCGELRGNDAGREVKIAGWVHRRRDYGGLIFIDLRDRYGLTQIVINEAEAGQATAVADKVRNEFVIQVRGKVARRLAGTENAKLETGEVEVQAASVEILGEAQTPPFYINEPDAPVDESLRLRHRYLDIRRRPMLERLLLRSELVKAVRDAHNRAGFVEIETPILLKSTPEGARDFIVPSRLQPGSVYALPQSPQQLKQMLMVAGVDRYFQIARCFRDEDLRGDRQPEFTQLDLEMSFVDEQRVMDFVEAMIIEVSKAVVPDRPIQQLPFPRIDYHEAIERYGSDKPDLRFGMELVDLVPAMGEGSTGFRVFDETLAVGGRVKAIAAPTMGESSRSQIEELVTFARRFGAKGLAHVSVQADGAGHSPIAKFLGDERIAAIVKAVDGKPGDLILIVADPDHELVADVLGRLRQELGNRLGLADENILAYCWVYHFPMYQWEPDLSRWHATHNPFSGVVPEDENLLVTASGDAYKPSHEDPAGKARAMQYDIALNGWELGGGSVRIHKRELLERSFALQGYSHEQMYERFGGLLEAFDYGAPPHGGIAMGIDRWAALFSHQTNIREVMAFPKTQSGTDLMLGSPSEPDAEQYSELGLRFVGIATAADAKSEAAE